MSLWVSKNGKWSITNWNKRTLAVLGDWVAYEAFYREDEGVVAYEFPERIPAYVKKEVERIFKERFANA